MDKDTSVCNVVLNNYPVAFKELDNNHQIYLQERMKNNKTYFKRQKFFRNKNKSQKLKLRLKTQ